MNLRSEGEAVSLLILLRNEVDAVLRGEENLHVEIKSHNSRYPPDMTHYAFCVLTRQTAGLYVVAHKPLEKVSSIVSSNMYNRDNLKFDGRKERYLRSLGVKKLLLTRV